MQIGVPREVKDGERRVGLTPQAVAVLVADGHEVHVESGAGEAVGFPDGDYVQAGAILAHAADSAWRCSLVVKVKEIQPGEYPRLVAGTTVLGFAQLNRDAALARAVLAAGVRVIACEAVEDREGRLPLLAPMSRIAGRLAPLVGAVALTGVDGGAGVLLPGVDDVPPARVVVVGAGTVGGEAARIAARIGCRVSVFSRGEARLRALAQALAACGTRVDAVTLDESRERVLGEAIADADLVIGAVLEPGRLSPKLLTRAMLCSMRPGSVLVDVGIDQGGIAETSRPTKLSSPTYREDGVVHYAVPNMPSLVARTATLALVGATLPYVRRLAAGMDDALQADPGLAKGLMVSAGRVVHAGLADDLGFSAAADVPQFRLSNR